MIRFSWGRSPQLLCGLAHHTLRFLQEHDRKPGAHQRLVDHTDDEELLEMWREDLVNAAVEADDALLGLLGAAALERGVLEVDEDELDTLLAGLSRARLLLRRHRLGQVSDEELEGGQVPWGAMSLAGRRSVLAYLFLGHLQETLTNMALGRLPGGAMQPEIP